MARGPKPLPLETRLMRHMYLDLDSGCWVWTGGNSKGYGRVWKDGTMRPTHQVSFELWRGKIPTGLELDHICRNHSCFNPSHLQAVTHQRNNEHTAGHSDSTSGIRGVAWDQDRMRWRASVMILGKNNYLGLYDDPKEAGEVAAQFRREHMTNSLLD